MSTVRHFFDADFSTKFTQHSGLVSAFPFFATKKKSAEKSI
jgi:hypothetical protein